MSRSRGAALALGLSLSIFLSLSADAFMIGGSFQAGIGVGGGGGYGSPWNVGFQQPQQFSPFLMQQQSFLPTINTYGLQPLNYTGYQSPMLTPHGDTVRLFDNWMTGLQYGSTQSVPGALLYNQWYGAQPMGFGSYLPCVGACKLYQASRYRSMMGVLGKSRGDFWSSGGYSSGSRYYRYKSRSRDYDRDDDRDYDRDDDDYDRKRRGPSKVGRFFKKVFVDAPKAVINGTADVAETAIDRTTDLVAAGGRGVVKIVKSLWPDGWFQSKDDCVAKKGAKCTCDEYEDGDSPIKVIDVVHTVTIEDEILRPLQPKDDGCPEDRKPAENPPSVYSYDACKKDNDYLEEQLAVQVTELGKEFLNSNISPACVKAALEGAPEGGGVFYAKGSGYANATCQEQDREALLSGTKRPCISERYHLVMYNSFVKSMDCLGLDPQEMFPLFAQESNFHVNIGNAWSKERHFDSLGVAQLTQIAIDEVNRTGPDQMDLSKPSCQELKSYVNHQMQSNVRQNCSRFSMRDGNPVKSYLYGGRLYKTQRDRVRVVLEKWTAYRSLPVADQSKIDLELARYAYNAGDGGIRTALSLYLAKNPGISSYESFRTSFKAFLAQDYGKTASGYLVKDMKQYSEKQVQDRRRIVSSYVSNIASRKDDYSNKVKTACGK